MNDCEKCQLVKKENFGYYVFYRCTLSNEQVGWVDTYFNKNYFYGTCYEEKLDDK